jgi:hypothetical protein
MSNQLQVTGEAKIRDIQGPVVANSGVITALDGDANQYVRGDGTLADFPTSTGGGSSVSYYLNSSVSQGTIGGNAYRELSKEPIIGAGTDIAISSNGYIANYITDANDPDVILIPGGNFNCEFYFSVNNNTGNPFFYAELYKYDGTTFTLLGSSVGVPEYINQGTTINPYYFAIPVSTATLALTDRLAIRIYVNVAGRTVTLHTENGHLCQVVTTLSKGMVSLNNLTDQSQFITTGTSGTNFNINSSGDTHTFNLPIASATNTGKLSSTDWTTFNNKQPAGNYVTLDTTQTITGSKTFSSVIGGDAGISLKEGVVPSGVGYTGLAGDADGLVITKRVGATAYTNLLYFNSATSNTYTFPNASGTIALTSNLSSYVPYTGATTNVNLGTNEITASNFVAETSFSTKILPSGVTFRNGYSTLSSIAGNFSITQAVSAGNLKAFTFDFSAWATNTSYTYTLPAASGTLALTSNLSSYVPYTGALSDVNIGNNRFYSRGLTLYTGATSFSQGFTTLNGNADGLTISLATSTTSYSNQFLFTQNVSNVYTFPAATGTLALTSNLSSYVPYSGATSNVNLGTYNLTTTGNVNATNFVGSQSAVLGAGTIGGTLALFPYATYTTNDGYLNIVASSTTKLNLIFGQGSSLYKTAIFDVAGLTNSVNRTYTLPDASGTLVLGTGTTNYLPKFTGASTLGDSVIQEVSGNIGIGGSPSGSYKFQLTGTSYFSGASTFASSINSGQIQATASGAVIQLIGQVGSNAYYVNDQVNNSGKRWRFGHTGAVSGYNSFDFYNQTDDRLVMTLASTGNVGIGTSSPSYLLDVNGAGRFNGKITSTVGNNNLILENTSATTGWIQPLRILNTGGHLGLWVEDSSGNNRASGSSAYAGGLCTYTSTALQFGTNNAIRMSITSGGDVKVQNNGNLALNGGCYILRNSSEVSYGYFIRTLGWKGGGNTDNTPAIAAEGGYGLNFYTNGTVDEKLRLYYDGYIALNSVVFGTTTSGTVRTLYIGNANYLLGGISSIRKSKTNIENVSNVNWIYDLKPVTFNYRKADENKNYTDEFYEDLNYGLIAEDTAPVADFLINYNDKEDGTKEMIGIEYPRLITPLLKAIQDQKKLIDELSAKVSALENKS